MPDSRPQSTPSHEQRFAIGVTRVCLTSGALQIPYAMRGVFEPGTYPVLDVERNETIDLIFDPPRSLQGLDEIFAAHELQPNDEVILTLAGDGLELEVKKRPRRKAPHAKGERWESVSGSHATTAATPHATSAPNERVRVEGGQPQLFGDAQAHEVERPPGTHAPDSDDEGAPRIVRARRIGKGEDRPRMQTPPPDASQEGRGRGHADEPGRTAERDSAARRFFEDPGDPDDPYAADAFADEGWQWERTETGERTDRPATDAALPASGGFFAKIAQAARGAFSFRGQDADEDFDSGAGSDEAPPPRGEAARVRPSSRDPRHDAPEPMPRDAPQARRRDEPDPRTSDRPEASHRAPRPAAEPVQRPPATRAVAAPEAAPAERPRNVVVEDPDADTMDRFGPAMWELGEGDLRQRLIRFLQHPDVPVILRTELVARNLGLGEEVAAAMLEDLSHDKIDGLVVTKVRDETYRISRAPSTL